MVETDDMGNGAPNRTGNEARGGDDVEDRTATYGIAELAREFGITSRAIRFYEDKGMLRPVRDGQRRIYSLKERVRLRLIMRGKRLGFSLDEVREMLDLYDIDPSEVTQLKVFLSKIRDRRAQLIRQQQDIEDTLAELDKLEAQSSALLSDRQGAGAAAE